MRKLAIVVALSSTVLATPALARDGAWYVGGDFGAMIVEDIGFDFGRGGSIPGGETQVEIDHRYGYDGALFAGYDLGSFRIEAEVAYKRARLDELETVINLPGFGPTFAGNGGARPQTVVDAGGGNTTAMSFMINGMLDFGDDEGISGFVGGGVGIARVNFNNQRAFSNQGAFLDDSDTRFAWQLLAGVRQAISDNIDVTVRYRFFNVDDLRTVNWLGDESETRFRSHSLLGGITFNFGAPEVIVPPAPCPPGWTRDINGVCQAPPAPPQEQVCPNGQRIPITQQCPVPQQVVGPFIVFFDWDKDDITTQAASILDNAAQAYASTGQARVVLAGHADRSGSASYNVGLSQRRANNVRQYLAGRGVPDSAMTTEAFGESRPLVETADGVREPQNRRVEITFGPGSGW